VASVREHIRNEVHAIFMQSSSLPYDTHYFFGITQSDFTCNTLKYLEIMRVLGCIRIICLLRKAGDILRISPGRSIKMLRHHTEVNHYVSGV
jgi:hypothetical protein